jgi:hypothetical protein
MARYGLARWVGTLPRGFGDGSDGCKVQHGSGLSSLRGDGAEPQRVGCAMLAVVRKVADLSRVGSALRNWHNSVSVWFAWVVRFVYLVRALNVGIVNDRFSGFLG